MFENLRINIWFEKKENIKHAIDGHKPVWKSVSGVLSVIYSKIV